MEIKKSLSPITQAHPQAFCRRNSDSFTKTVEKNMLSLEKRKNSISNIGFDPSYILSSHSNNLTAHEKVEIQNYKSIYFIGNHGVQKFEDRFCSKKGVYRGLTGDHIRYRYEIFRELGRGSFGIVFKCWDHKRSEEVAIKIIKNKQKYRQAGNFESILLDQVKENDLNDSSCIVRKYKSFEFRGHLCLVFELLHCTLSEFLLENEQKGVDIILVKRIAIQLLQGLKFLHNLKYLHCDLKPDNIMMKYPNKSKVKIIDLGSALYNHSKSLPKYIQTRYYRAPEIILGMDFGAGIDFWSLGCIIIELIIGTPLFYAPTETDLLYSIIEYIGLPPEYILHKARKAKNFFRESRLFYPEKIKIKSIEETLSRASKTCIEFVKMCLMWDPDLRINAESGLNHNWIKSLNKRNYR